MIEAYSQNVTVSTNTYIPISNVAITKGDSAELSGTATIRFNKCGLYLVSVTVSAEAEAVGVISLQLTKNGNYIPQTAIQETATDTTSSHQLSFTTAVQVPNTNLCRCCTSPTTIGILNTGVEAIYSLVDIVVTRIC